VKAINTPKIARFNAAIKSKNREEVNNLIQFIRDPANQYPECLRDYVLKTAQSADLYEHNITNGSNFDASEGQYRFHPHGFLLDKKYNLAIVSSEILQDKFYRYNKKDTFASAMKLIAFYLPQFHPFKENDQWWGKGFTEWTNVGKAKPLFDDHYQPHCPIHLGYYDLRITENMIEQAELAKNYGINGFAYYVYWFKGKTIMETPLENMLKEPRIDIPFCITWANENWTRRWDGQEEDILISQEHSLADSKEFLIYMQKYFLDNRYICHENKPVIIIYRANIIPEISLTIKHWREMAIEMGFAGLYLIAAQTV